GYSTPALDLYSTPPEMTSAASGNVLCSRVYRVARSIIFNVLENDQAGRSPPLCSRSDITAHCYSSNWFAGTPVDDNTAAFIAAVHAPTMEPRHFGSSPAWNLEPSTLLCTAAPPPRTINYRISPKAGASPLRPQFMRLYLRPTLCVVLLRQLFRTSLQSREIQVSSETRFST
ncbi:hypothetical protein HID58_035696, partial [Brassica napus]